ncbi:hypothetical protein [Phyllobacterium sp. YR620]|uniref:hypothetical protein n=1 Tax=Phyllobacterium sp. YR620 TaxID=1881066 RepID=UPI00111381A2|nr:hypothetical protein [Phyllobacterium sp. YR620]
MKRNTSMAFDNPLNPMYSQDDWDIMQAAYDKAAATLVVKSSSDEEAKVIAETVMTAFNRGNRDINSLAALAVVIAVNSHPTVSGTKDGAEQRVA